MGRIARDTFIALQRHLLESSWSSSKKESAMRKKGRERERIRTFLGGDKLI